jgi:hypothetical protein
VSAEELARRVISEHQYAAMHVGAIPEQFGIPVPADGRVVGSVIRGPEDDPDGVTAYLDVPGSADQIRARFDELFGARGYRPKAHGFLGQGGGGFQHTMMPMGMAQGAMYCAGEEDAFYNLRIGAGDPAPVSVMWNTGQMGRNPCSSGPQGHPVQEMEEVPSLSAPPGVMVQGGGGGGSPGAWYAQGIALTEIAPRALLDHFAKELEGGKAALIAREDGNSASWGRWKMPTKDLESIVGVIGAHPKMRLLLRYTYSPAQQERQNRRLHRSGWSAMRRLG